MQDFYPLFIVYTKTWYYLYISYQFWWSTKMLTALFNLVWNTQKSVWTIFLECQGKVFVSNEKILEKIRQDQP